MRISDWSSDVCSSDLAPELARSRRPLVDGGGHLCPTFASQEAHLLIDDPERSVAVVASLCPTNDRLRSLAPHFDLCRCQHARAACRSGKGTRLPCNRGAGDRKSTRLNSSQ